MEAKKLHQVNINASVWTPFSLSWSEDDKIAVPNKEGIVILGVLLHIRVPTMNWHQNGTPLWLALLCLLFLPTAFTSNITDVVFGWTTDVMPAAFGDFNSDELTDMFVLRNNARTVQVLLASTNEPLLRAEPALQCHFARLKITSLVPGDFDGDSQMDILVTALDPDAPTMTQVLMLWGGSTTLNCSDENVPLISMKGQPVALDYDRNNIMDLFGSDVFGNRTLWLFTQNRSVEAQLFPGESRNPLRIPHSHAFLDVNSDFAPDLVISTPTGYEVWLGNASRPGLTLNATIPAPTAAIVGQSVFLDLSQTGRQDHLVPVCVDDKCTNSTILVYLNETWVDLRPTLTNAQQTWGFVLPKGQRYTDTITLRVGDFNMDGWFDLIATLQCAATGSQRAYLLENVECNQASCKEAGRSFVVLWDVLSPLNNQSTTAMFYDVYQDGILDVILAGDTRVQAYRNNLDYDANFVKVMVVGLGGNLPGASVAYRTTLPQGAMKESQAAQLPQSAHFSLALPYVIFGLGRTPNFVETLIVGVNGKHKEWTQIIPNSQMVVTTVPRWRVKLFVTPSKLILMSVLALASTCVFIAAIIGVLYWKERREDRLEKLQEAHRFHFDAM